MKSKSMSALLDCLEDLYHDIYEDRADLYITFMGYRRSPAAGFWTIQNNRGFGCGNGQTIIGAYNDYEQKLLIYGNCHP